MQMKRNYKAPETQVIYVYAECALPEYSQTKMGSNSAEKIVVGGDTDPGFEINGKKSDAWGNSDDQGYEY